MPSHLWQSAASYAAWAHRHQFRKDRTTPYVAHVFRVAMTVRDVFGCDDEATLAAALLHDTIEDTPVDFDDIDKRFGREVAELVAALTKDMRLVEAEREPAYDEQLKRASWKAKLIKLADTYDNLSDRLAQGKNGSTLRKMRERCQRSIAIAEPDRDNEYIARGIECVRGLVEASGSLKV
ncbi:MAG: HD domain-containing protein [Phycisphaerales bacterium]